MDHLSGLWQAAESIDPTEEKQEPPRRHNRRNQVREMNRRCLGASQQGQLKHVEMMQLYRNLWFVMFKIQRYHIVPAHSVFTALGM